MTKAAALLATVLTCILAPIAAYGQEPIIPPRELWPQATALVRAGNLPAASEKVEQLLRTGRTLGISRFPAFADSAAALAQQADHQNNRELSAWAIATAHQLDPNSPDVDFAAADIARRRSDWGTWLKAVMSGFGKTFTNYRARVIASADMLIVACTAAMILAGAFGLILLFRYAKAAAHDFREFFSTRLSPGTSWVLAWAALLLPVYLWLGPTWVLLYWFVLFFAYATLPERVAIVILLVVLSALPIVLSFASYRIAGVDSPVIQAAVADAEDSLSPEALRRLRELGEILPNEPVILMLIGNLEVQDANERAAAQHYRQALQLNDRLAGAHLNLGNLYYLENDFPTATLQYELAAKADPGLAIAYYNRSVASGELYKFDEQGRQLELAKQRDRALINDLLTNPPQPKVVMYELPIGTAWAVAERIARSGQAREIYGNHAVFDLAETIRNPLTFAALAAIPLAFLLWMMRRKNGVAGECIKCGRTFCYRCKASRESSSYCTQCIHIYLKRDGVSLDTKRDKLQEVQDYQTADLRRTKVLSTLLPGAGQIVSDRTVRGVLVLLLFIALISLAFYMGRLAPVAAPAQSMKESIRVLAIAAAVIVWLAANIPVYRKKVTV
jgi:tetratricopeptide (TPR) repeat protein